MRVISGSAGGLTLVVPKGHKVRPTADRVRESVFNILVSRFSLTDTDILDLFAGTGGLGIEALSRGGRSGVFVDTSPDAQKVIRANLKTTRLLHRGRLLRASALTGIRIVEDQGFRFGGVFLDPPYGEGWVDKNPAAFSAEPGPPHRGLGRCRAYAAGVWSPGLRLLGIDGPSSLRHNRGVFLPA